MTSDSNEPDWEWEISPKDHWFRLQLTELVNYRDLIISFFRKELLASYQQTVAGIFWIILQPVLTTVLYVIVFSGIVKVSTNGIPPVLFFMVSSILWGYFSDCLNGSMYSFLHNAHIYSKVYFPRLVVPVSMILTHSVRFLIQFTLFILVYCFYLFFNHSIAINPARLVLAPFLLLFIIAFASGFGMMMSVFIAKYKDVEFLMNFLLRLFMFITPVLYPSSIVPEKFKLLFWLNPLTPVIESFRSIFFGHGPLPYYWLTISGLTSTALLLIGLIVFKRKEISVMDTI